METKKFHISAILSVITGRLLTHRPSGGIEEVYDLLDFMTNGVFMENMLGNNLHSHVFRRICEDCSSHLIRQFPQLVVSDETDLKEDLEVLDKELKNRGKKSSHEIVTEWLVGQVEKHGTEFVVEPIADYKPGVSP